MYQERCNEPLRRIQFSFSTGRVLRRSPDETVAYRRDSRGKMTKDSWVLLGFSAIGFFGVNFVFLYWQLFEFSWQAFSKNTIGIALFVEVSLITVLLALYFKRCPIGPYKWYWFVCLSLIGSLLFGLPFFYWLNKRKSHADPILTE